MGETIELLSIEELIKNGGIFFNVKGDRPETVFKIF